MFVSAALSEEKRGEERRGERREVMGEVRRGKEKKEGKERRGELKRRSNKLYVQCCK